MIMVNIRRKNTRDKWNGMIMGVMGGWESLGVVKNRLVFGEDKLHIRMNNGGRSLNCLNGMELRNNVRMTLF
jgi:hypothetical protein